MANSAWARRAGSRTDPIPAPYQNKKPRSTVGAPARLPSRCALSAARPAKRRSPVAAPASQSIPGQKPPDQPPSRDHVHSPVRGSANTGNRPDATRPVCSTRASKPASTCDRTCSSLCLPALHAPPPAVTSNARHRPGGPRTTPRRTLPILPAARSACPGPSRHPPAMAQVMAVPAQGDHRPPRRRRRRATRCCRAHARSASGPHQEISYPTRSADQPDQYPNRRMPSDARGRTDRRILRPPQRFPSCPRLRELAA